MAFTTFTAGTKAKASEVNANFIEMGSRKIGSGSVTLQAATTAYDTDYIDIVVPSGVFTSSDMLELEVIGTSSDKRVSSRVDISGTSSPGVLATVSIYIESTSDQGGYRLKFIENPDTNTNMIAWADRGDKVTTSGVGYGSTYGSGDANIFDNGFTVRVNFLNQVGAAGDGIQFAILRGIIG